MKSLDEAILCLRSEPGEGAGPIDIVIGEFSSEVSPPAALTVASASMIELGKDISQCKEVEYWAASVLKVHFGAIKSGEFTPAEAMYSAVLSAFTSGVRVGMEMEKA